MSAQAVIREKLARIAELNKQIKEAREQQAQVEKLKMRAYDEYVAMKGAGRLAEAQARFGGLTLAADADGGVSEGKGGEPEPDEGLYV